MARGHAVVLGGTGTAARIREAATRLFYAESFAVTTMREIAVASDLTAGAIYNHFSSKDDILYSIARCAHDALDRELSGALRSAVDQPTARLKATMTAFVLYHIRYPQAALVANRDYPFMPEPSRSEIIGRRRATRALFQRLIEDGVKAGCIRLPAAAAASPSVSTEVLAMDLTTMLVMVAKWYRPTGTLSAIQIANLQAELGLQLVGAKAGYVGVAQRHSAEVGWDSDGGA
jgi:AcrR family transcriptional regulator